MIRKTLAVAMLLGVCMSSAWSAERLALGLIVKLKDRAPESVVRLAATAPQREMPQRLRERLAAATQRARVSYLVQRPTAFAATVIHNGRPMALSAARAEADRLRRDPDVEWVVVNELEQPHAVLPPNDPLYAQQTWLSQSAIGGVPNVPAAWDFLSTRTLSPIVVAVLDTGVLQHPDLAGRTLPGYDFVSEADYANDGNGRDPDPSDPGDYLTSGQISANPPLYADCGGPGNSSWHGTAIAGQLAALTDNGTGVAGILRPMAGAPVLPVRVAGQCGAAVIDIIEGMMWAAGISFNGSPAANPYPARVINLSFGGESDCTCVRGGSTLSGACLYQDAISALKQKGAILVASAGNASMSNVNGDNRASRPANCPGAVAVTALNASGRKAQYANLTGTTGVATMGGDSSHGDPGIYSTDNSGMQGPVLNAGLPEAHYGYKQGTSFSAPIVSGAIALMWSVNPGLSVDQVIGALHTVGQGVRAHAQSLGLPSCSAIQSGSCNCTSSSCGPGTLDVESAVRWAANTAAAPPSTGSGGGGGGAIDSASLWGAGLLALLLLGERAWRWRASGAAGGKALA